MGWWGFGRVDWCLYVRVRARAVAAFESYAAEALAPLVLEAGIINWTRADHSGFSVSMVSIAYIVYVAC